MSERQKGLRILCLGDIVARPGRGALVNLLPVVRKEHEIDFVVANGENASGGTGLDPRAAREILKAGVDVITLGDHTWRHRELRPFLSKNCHSVIRPANYPGGAPGRGATVVRLPHGGSIGVMNLIGRVFMNIPLDCPFQKADELLSHELKDADVIICDFHAEATSEKIAMGRYLDGRVGLCFGTHTHVQTADEQVLAKGTAYITDVGMCGSNAGVIGLDGETAVDRFVSGLPSSYKPAKGSSRLNGILMDYDLSEKNVLRLERLNIADVEHS
ncbi:MAG: TIGR00282 family metallophosphoesterase [Bdellovibrionales bacterium]|nr:TIGR00282 family metallophosphoesterase [Bdellovibrionales bacterium]